MKKSYVWFLYYLGCVLLFSFVYWGIWLHKPDRFIINPQLNMHPFQSIEDFLWEDKPEYQTRFHVDLSKYKTEYDAYYLKISEAEQQILNIERELKNLEVRLLDLDKKRNSEVDFNFKKYDEEKLKPFKDAEEALQKQLTALEVQLPKEVKTEADLDIIKKVGDKRVELAKARYQTAVQATINSEVLLQNIAGFMSDETWTGYRDVSEMRKKLHQKRYKYEVVIGDTRVKAIDVLKNDIELIRGRVGWADFVFLVLVFQQQQRLGT
ncbi:hypothetical protein [Thalassomonas actiniarum]|uniref:Uncharacterized protein n=1 Tax=Thalassomonas actiniarum TaxID=485447 RepID=A0AAE9YPN7_9GAMM|nr:hypothetical protein [Thalassomonas actiniarum]WDD97241.1 hypothetical protein SG35_018085 [Thalassomonas actiniarum]